MVSGVFRKDRYYLMLRRRAIRIPQPAAGATLTASGTPTADQATATGAANASGVSITDVNTTESWNDGDTGLVITGGGFV